jgi:prepilin-type N-terminal cleavage/methylation domain-containing protein
MTRLRSRGLGNQAGFSLVEMLISTAIMLVVTGSIFRLMNPSQGNAQAQPEVADIQQRMRVATDVLFKELIIAGAGPYQGPVTGSLVNFFASVVPRRTGDLNADPTIGNASFTTDKITLTYIPNSYSQTTISAAMPPQSAELKVNNQPNCPNADPLCGFQVGMDVVIFDTSGNWDTFTITQVQDAAGHMQHRGQDLNYSYASGASVTQVVSNTYYLNRATNQLMKYDGHTTETPLADNVVDLRFDYFGDTASPTMPKPMLGTANCLYDAAGNFIPRPTLAATDGSLAALTAAMLTDGPYCGSGDNQFDVDLLRIRKVKVTIRMQASASSLRGNDPTRFVNRGTAVGGERYVPDYQMQFEVAPRNLNLTR